MMQGAITLTILCATVFVTAQAFQDNHPLLNLPGRELFASMRFRRQYSKACIDDVNRYLESDLMHCQDLSENPTPANANEFCAKGCASLLHDMYDKLKRDCPQYREAVSCSMDRMYTH